MSAKKKEYNNESIKSLKGPDRVRKRPAVIFGSDDITGAQHAAFEIIANSVDEAREGHGNKIIVTKYEDGSVSVEDFGRGIPVEFNNAENRYNWDLVFCELYAGGKYDQGAGEDYSFALGLNGLGTCSTQYSSEYMDVRVRRDGFQYDLHFEKGVNTMEEPGFTKKKTSKPSGTFIRFKLDGEVFTDTDIPPEYFEDCLKRQAIVNAGVEFVFINGQEEKHFLYPDGIVEHVKELSKTPISLIQSLSKESRGRDAEDRPEYTLRMNFAFVFVKDGGVQEHYHNSSFLEYGGSPLKAARKAFTNSVDRYIKAQGKYTKNENKVDIGDIEDSLIFVSNCFSNIVSYENQTKKAIRNSFAEKEEQRVLEEYLDKYFAENKAEADAVTAQILVNKRAREQAESAKVSIKKKLSGSLNTFSRPDNYIECRSKKTEERELYIVEGLSALGSVKQARNAEFQALISIRGKILNCLKTDLPRIFKSDIITDLIKVIGCGVEVKASGKGIPPFDMSKLRFGKIILMSDQDVDGFQIRCLLLTMFYRLCPTLIREGKIYIGESPLYEITYKDKTYFAYDDKEKDKILKGFKGPGAKIQRSKGLGENDPEMMSLTAMDPATRRLIRITENDVKDLYDVLMGNDLAGRKAYIEAHGAEYTDLDV